MDKQFLGRITRVGWEEVGPETPSSRTGTMLRTTSRQKFASKDSRSKKLESTNCTKHIYRYICAAGSPETKVAHNVEPYATTVPTLGGAR